jgi:DNA-directed RNA polymerase subunit RPC12/RpoP
MTAHCPKCGEIKIESNIVDGKCPYCGQPVLRELFYWTSNMSGKCPQCEHQVSIPQFSKDLICSNCGTKLRAIKMF